MLDRCFGFMGQTPNCGKYTVYFCNYVIESYPNSFFIAAELSFRKMICHLSFFGLDPFIEAASDDDRYRVTDPLHLSSVIPV